MKKNRSEGVKIEIIYIDKLDFESYLFLNIVKQFNIERERQRER